MWPAAASVADRCRNREDCPGATRPVSDPRTTVCQKRHGSVNRGSHRRGSEPDARTKAQEPTADRQGLLVSEAEDRTDAVGVGDGSSAEADDRAAVEDRAVDREIGGVVAFLELRAVQGALAAVGVRAAAVGAGPRLVTGRLGDEQDRDAPIRGGLEGLPPARGGAAVAAVFRLPPFEQLLVLARASFVEQRADDLEDLAGGRVRLGVRPADDRLAGLVRQLRLELTSHLLGRDDDHVQPASAAKRAIDLVADGLQVVKDNVLDVPLVAGLRPAALVVLSGNLLRLVRDLLQASVAQLVDKAALPRDDRDECAVPLAELPDEGREPQLRADLPAVGGREQRHDAEEIVRPRREDGEGPSAVAVELVLSPVLDPSEVGLEGELAVTSPGRRAVLGRFLGLLDDRAELGLLTRNRRHSRRIEVHVDADRTAVLRAKARELPEQPFGHD